MQNLVTIGRSATELLCIFDFQNGGRPPSWIWYDVTSDHPRLVFDGPNIRLKLHVDHVYTLQDIEIFTRGRSKRGICYGNVAGWLGGWLAGCPSHAGTVSKRLNVS